MQVWSSARGCYRVYSRFWPDLARRLYLLLDPAVQKVSIYNNYAHQHLLVDPILISESPMNSIEVAKWIPSLFCFVALE